MKAGREESVRGREDVMFCMNCGKKIPEDSRVCPYCGKVLASGGGSAASGAKQADPVWDNNKGGSAESGGDIYWNHAGAGKGSRNQNASNSGQNPYYNTGAGQNSVYWGHSNSQDRRTVGAIAYVAGLIGLCIAWGMHDRNNEYEHFHVNQALVLFVFTDIFIAIIYIAAGYPVFFSNENVRYIVLLVGEILLLFMLIESLIGFVSACRGKMRRVPIFGRIQWLKK